MAQHIGELSERMREIFGLVVEAYLDRGAAGRIEGAGRHGQPVARVDPRRDAGSRGAGPADPSAYVRRADSDGNGPAGCSSTGSCRWLRPTRGERREIERQIARDQPIEDALAAASAALSGLSQAAGVVLAPKSEMRLKQLGLVPLGPDRALAVLVGADGNIENRIVNLDGLTSADALTEVANFINAHLSGLTLAEAQARLLAEIRDHREALDRAAAELIAHRPRCLERRSCAEARPHRPRAGEPHRRRCGGRPGAGSEFARRA